MPNINKRHRPRKAISEFLDENIPNQILYKCLKENTGISDDNILDAFNNAYTIGIEVVADISVHTVRSFSFSEFTNISSQSLLSHSLVYCLLSFHPEAPKLTQYLANLKSLLIQRYEKVFSPLLITTSAMASILPGTVTFFPPKKEEAIPENSKQYIKISTLIAKAEEMPKQENIIVLNALQQAIAHENDDWSEIIRFAIERAEKRPETAPVRSRYRIAKDHQTTFVKLMKIICQTHIFETLDGKLVSNVEDFTRDTAAFLNTTIKNPSSLLSAARKTDTFMTIFDTLHKYAYDYYTKDDGLTNSNQQYSQSEIF